MYIHNYVLILQKMFNTESFVLEIPLKWVGVVGWVG